MMKLNKKGMTMVEIIVSISLLSIVLIFLMGLFVKIRTTYNQSIIKSDYDILVANILNAIGDDIDEYGLYGVDYENSEEKSVVIFTYDTFRSSHLSDRIKKILRVYFKNNRFYISYAYESKYTPDITSLERISGVVREMPSDVSVDRSNYIELYKTPVGMDVLVEVKIPLSDSQGNIYDINTYGLIKATT